MEISDTLLLEWMRQRAALLAAGYDPYNSAPCRVLLNGIGLTIGHIK